MENLIKLLWPNSLFEISKVRLTGDTIIGYPGIGPVASSFIFIMERGDKLCVRFEPIQIPRKAKDKDRSRIKTDFSLPAIGGGNFGSYKGKIYKRGSQIREGKVPLRADTYKSSFVLIQG